ncbi:MAG TPA: 2-oxoacid:ferredoxin oxidoreductase subunit beta [Limnochordia bacterium]|nr:2-oxoacid:ferredoxin oxidoreductase subunit beta [Limnochordia bacterium]
MPQLKLADYKTEADNWWCPGCGDFGVLRSLHMALAELQIPPEKIALVAGIGCSGKIANYVKSYNMHVVHGRALPAAQGIKLANHDLTVLAAGGDGDGYGIGMGHFLHAIRRNIDITYIVMDNHVYGLTKGQISPTSDAGFKAKAAKPQEDGQIEHQVRPLQLAIAGGATFVAQGFSGQVKELASIIAKAITHKGFSLVNTISPCVTYNYVNTYDFYRDKLRSVADLDGYDPSDRQMALQTVVETGGLIGGILFQEETPSYVDCLPHKPETPLAEQDLKLPREQFDRYVEAFR